jgi:hypothetical protein
VPEGAKRERKGNIVKRLTKNRHLANKKGESKGKSRIELKTMIKMLIIKTESNKRVQEIQRINHNS